MYTNIIYNEKQESLLYFVRVVKFRQLICQTILHQAKAKESNDDIQIKYQSIDDDSEVNVTNILQCVARLRLCYALKFNYLEHVNESIRPGIVQFDTETIHDIASDIYLQCIVVNSVNEINISYECSQELKDFFENNLDKTITDYLSIYDDSMIEIYSLLNSVYRFKFVSN